MSNQCLLLKGLLWVVPKTWACIFSGTWASGQSHESIGEIFFTILGIGPLECWQLLIFRSSLAVSHFVYSGARYPRQVLLLLSLSLFVPHWWESDKHYATACLNTFNSGKDHVTRAPKADRLKARGNNPPSLSIQSFADEKASSADKAIRCFTSSNRFQLMRSVLSNGLVTKMWLDISCV